MSWPLSETLFPSSLLTCVRSLVCLEVGAFGVDLVTVGEVAPVVPLLPVLICVRLLLLLQRLLLLLLLLLLSQNIGVSRPYPLGLDNATSGPSRRPRLELHGRQGDEPGDGAAASGGAGSTRIRHPDYGGSCPALACHPSSASTARHPDYSGCGGGFGRGGRCHRAALALLQWLGGFVAVGRPALAEVPADDGAGCCCCSCGGSSVLERPDARR